MIIVHPIFGTSYMLHGLASHTLAVVNCFGLECISKSVAWRVIEVCKADRTMRGPKLSLLICPMPSEFILPHMNRKHQEHITLQLKTSISSSRNHLPISICIVVFSVFAFVKSNHCKDKDIEGDKALDKR